MPAGWSAADSPAPCLDKLQEGGALRRWRKDEALRRADAELAQMQHLLEAFAAFRNHVQPRNG